MRLHSGHLLTLDPARPSGSGVLVRGGRVVEIESPGVPRRAASDEVERDLEGRFLLPAFHDAHLHLTQTGLALDRVRLGGARSAEEALALLRAALDRPREGRVLVGEGLDESGWADPRLPSRADLDGISTEVPIVARRVCLHKAVANGAALPLFGDAGDRVDRERGVLLEEAAFSLDARVAPRPEDRERPLLRGAALALSRGVASAEEITSWPSVLAALSIAEEDRLPIRLIVHILYEDLARARALGLVSGAKIGPRGRLVVGGIKLFADGSIGARTAALREPYHDAPDTRGLLLLSAPEIAGRLREIEAAGFRALVHVIGDRALDAVLDAFDLLAAAPGNPRGHRLEHVEIIPDDAALERLARSGLGVAFQPNFVANWGGPGGLYERRLGGARVRRMNLFGSALGASIPFAFSSDAMPIDPLLGIRAAVGHPVPGERLDELEALRRYTAPLSPAQEGGPARGVIAPGAAADLVVLEGTREGIARDAATRVRATIVEGETAFDAAAAGAGAP